MSNSQEYIPFLEMREAIFGRLSSYLPALGFGYSIWPFVGPAEAEKPAVIIAGFTAEGEKFKGDALKRITAAIEVLHELEGDDEIAKTINAIIESFTSAPLDIPGGFQEAFGMGSLEVADLAGAWTGDRVILKGLVRYQWTIQRVLGR